MKILEPIQTTLKKGLPVEIGRLGKIKDYFIFESQNLNNTPAEREVFYVASLITNFNNSENFSLNEIALLEITDFNHLLSCCNKYCENIAKPYLYDERTIKLGYGVELNGAIYDLIEFDKTAKPLDKIEAEKFGLSPSAVKMYLVMKEISVIKQSESGIVFDGEITFDDLGEMTLNEGSEFILLRDKMRDDEYCKQRADEVWDAVLNTGFLQ